MCLSTTDFPEIKFMSKSEQGWIQDSSQILSCELGTWCQEASTAVLVVVPGTH